MEYWAGYVVAGRSIHRDRPAEFTAAGPAAGLIECTQVARRQFHADVATARPDDAPRGEPDGPPDPSPNGRSQRGALQHVYEELAKHRGQLEITRDVLVSAASR